MALPLAPIAGVALRYGAVALVAYVATRRGRVPRGRTDQRAEDAMDELPEGVTAHHAADRDQYNGTAHFRRTVRVGPHGPGVEIDISALGRLRLRRV